MLKPRTRITFGNRPEIKSRNSLIPNLLGWKKHFGCVAAQKLLYYSGLLWDGFWVGSEYEIDAVVETRLIVAEVVVIVE